jgi:hypothetical protein
MNSLWPLPIRQRLIFIIMIIFAVITILMLLVVKTKSINEYYTRRLDTLQTDVSGIPSILETDNNQIEAKLSTYEDKMNKISNNCQALLSKNKDMSKTPKDLRQQTEKVHKLCTDLIAITIYSSALYDSLHDYILLPSSSLPPVNSTEFGQRLNQSAQTIKTSQINLFRLDNSKIKDPALDELKLQLDDAMKKAKDAQEALKAKDYETAERQASQLLKLTNQDKQDFLNARNYFWNNTVQIDALIKSIAKLKTDFKH